MNEKAQRLRRIQNQTQTPDDRCRHNTKEECVFFGGGYFVCFQFCVVVVVVIVLLFGFYFSSILAILPTMSMSSFVLIPRSSMGSSIGRPLGNRFFTSRTDYVY